jgi:hypothetical protein
MAKSFYMEMRGFKELKRFFKKAPELFQPVVANVLTSYAFETRKNDIQNIGAMMIIRNRRFIESNLRVKAAKNVSISKQESLAYSQKKPRFSGWEEQEYGTPPKRKRSITTHARRGNKQNVVQSAARLKPQNKFWKPEQYAGRSYNQKFYFMMRVLNSRGGVQRFILQRKLSTKRGAIGRGLYELKGHKITRLQDFDKKISIKRRAFRTASLNQLSTKNKTTEIWQRSLNHIIKRYRR